MKPILTHIFAGLFLLLASQVSGQMTTSFVVTSPAAPGPYPIGTKLVVELRVTNFTNIESMQFPIAFNKLCLKFDSITNPVFSNWSAGNFTSPANSGKVGISWDGFSNGANMPFSFPNGTAIFKLHFSVIGNGTSNINISAASAPPAIDVVGNGQQVILNFQSGGTPTLVLGSGDPPPPPLVGFKIVANSIYIPQGERGCMPVTVNDFDNIASMQWALHWDNTVLNYECTRRYNLSGLSANDIGLSQITPATLVLAWSDPAGTGVTVPDGGRIVDICFKAIAAPGTASTITIDGIGLPPSAGTEEAYNGNSMNVWTMDNHPNGASGVSNPITVNPNPVSPFDVTYTVDKVDAAPNTEGCVSVRVKNFNAITASEFALSYNPLELTYVKTEFLPNPMNLVLATHITHVANPGVIKFRWDNTNAATVAADSAIFKSCFTVIAPAGTTSNIAFTTTPCPAPMCTMCSTITGMGTAKASGGVPMGRVNGWIKSVPSGPDLVPTHVKCFGAATGSIALTNPPSTTATAYVWAGPGINGTNQGMEDPTGLLAGTYTVTVTYSNATTGTRSTTIDQPAAALAQTNTVNTVSCFLGTNGAINLTPTGGTGSYTYLWSNGATVQDPTGLAVDFYSVTTTDANACTVVTANIVVTGFSEIKLPNTPANVIITQPTCAGLSNGSIDINPTGGVPGGYTYLWTGGSTGKQLTNKPAGSYAVTVTDMNGCSKVFSNLTITAPPPLTGVLVSKTDVKCKGSATGSADITLGGGTGALSVCWSTSPVGCASIIPDPNNLSAGTYTVIVTDDKGCTTTIPNVVIAEPTNALTVTGTGTSAQCFGQNTGSINLNVSGGWAGAYTYQWDNTNPSLPDPPQIEDPIGVPPSVYVVTVTDSGQCSTTQSVTVNGPQTDITAATTLGNVKCSGGSDGSIDLNLTGGNGGAYNVIWSNGQTGEAITGLDPGTYQPTVTDNQMCTKVLSGITVTEPPALSIDSTITAATSNDGSILLILGGGTPGFTYLWSNGATTKNISNLAIGTYSVTITDANNCILTYTFSVPSGNVLVGTTFTTKPSCSDDGCIRLTLPSTASGLAPYTLNWGVGTIQVTSLIDSICNLKPGVYNVTITAANGNTTLISAVEIKQSDPASVDVNTTNPFSGLVKNGKITLTPALGVICNLQYQWGPFPLNSTSNEVLNLGQGTYFVTITNPCSGCTSVRQFTLEYSPLAVAINGAAGMISPDCSNNPTGSINITVQGGNPPYTYVWTGPSGFMETTEDIKDLYPGVYSVVATDVDSRTVTGSFTLTSLSNLNITNVNETSLYGPFQVSGDTVCDGEASVVFTAGAGNSVIEWSNGVTGVNNTTLCGGPYSVTITDAAGCSTVWSDELTAPPPIAAQQESAGVKCNGDCDGTAKVSPVGGVAPYVVEWSTTQKDPVFANGFSRAVNLCGGDYSVTVTDKNNVVFVLTVNVPEPAPIEILFSTTAPRNFNACDGDILIDVNGATAPITYYWDTDLERRTGDTERAEELCSGESVAFYITDANGCTARDTASVPYPEDGCFRVSPILTPGQQDGKNDFVIITCIETALENRMEIYNRWGQLVFESDNYSNNDTDLEHNWNGLNSSGAALAEGVYYYVLTFSFLDDQGNTQEGTRKGAINLLR